MYDGPLFQARRTPLIQAVIHAKEDMVVFILSLPYVVDLNAQDVVNVWLSCLEFCLKINEEPS